MSVKSSKRRVPWAALAPAPWYRHRPSGNTRRPSAEAKWHEPDLSRAYFDLHFTAPEHEWDDYDTAMRALAFDGLLAGATWNLE
ncbi:hypothetical protein [Kitasatospora phosalacinea]|nr:hypothetical protein [Kitasatospora phosalacinea]